MGILYIDRYKKKTIYQGWELKYTCTRGGHV